MVEIIWDEVGEKTYQTGIDRGVLYLPDGTSAPWNGLISVDESPNHELKAFHLDGVKYLENLVPGDFVGTLKAYTYPDEFEAVSGINSIFRGLSLHDQPPNSFGLSYRTKIGNDISGLDFAYKIHLLYNLVANPESHSYQTLSDSNVDPIQFAWQITGTPVKAIGYRPTSHLSIDSRDTPSDVLEYIEANLYGTSGSNPVLMSLQDIVDYFASEA